MKVSYVICDKRGCQRKATQAWDCRGNGSVFAPQPRERHYELCDEHSDEFFGNGGWIHKDKSARIVAELVPS